MPTPQRKQIVQILDAFLGRDKVKKKVGIQLGPFSNSYDLPAGACNIMLRAAKLVALARSRKPKQTLRPCQHYLSSKEILINAFIAADFISST
jgi:hypothetical protein